MKAEYKKLFNFFGGDIVVPLYKFRKYPTDKNWQEKKYNINAFNRATGIGIKINKCKDLCCLDIDIKPEKFTEDTIKKTKDLIINFTLKNKNIYLEQTQSGSFHLFFKLRKKELVYLHQLYSADDRHVAKEVELFPNIHSSTRQIVIAPSRGEKGIYKSLVGDITNCDYIDINKIEELILSLRKILGIHEVKQKKIKRNGKVIEINIDKEYNKFTKKLTEDEKQLLSNLKEVILEYNLLEYFLKFLQIDYTEKEKTFNLYSVITEDGQNPDAYVFKDTLVYYDFHNNKGYNFIYLAYMLYKNKVIEFYNQCKKIENDLEDNYTTIDNTIEIDSINEIKDKLLEGKKCLIAQTGAGKSKTIKELAQQGNKIIMLEPLTIQVLQEDKLNQNFVACFCEGAVNTKITPNTTLIVCTYDKFKDVIKEVNLDEWKIVIDEAHELICALSYRKLVIEFIWEILEKRHQYLLMTATNYLLFLNDYVDVCYKVKPKEKKNRSFYHIKTNNILKQIVENVLLNYNNNVTQFVYIDNRNDLRKIFNTLLENGVDFNDISIINADNKIYDAKDIINEMKTKKKIYLSTRVLSAGFHIITNEKYLYHIVPNDINVLIQETNRVRENNNNEVILFIYHNRRKKHENINFNFEWRQSYHRKTKFIEKIKKKLDEYKEIRKKEYLDGNWNLYNATQKEYWIRYLVYKQLIIKASKNINYITQALKNEGFKECDIINMESYKSLIAVDTSTEYDELFEEFLYNDAKISENDNKVKKEIFYIVNKIKKYPEVFTDEDIETYKTKIRNGQIRAVKISITKKINQYAIENLNDVGGKTKAIIESKFNAVNNILQKKYTVSKKVIKKLMEEYNITNIEMNILLKNNGFKWDKSKKRYVKT